MKPCLIFKYKNSPFLYAQIRLPGGTVTSNRAKGKESKFEAERVVMQWIVSGNILTTVSCNKRRKNNILETKNISEKITLYAITIHIA